MTATQTFFGPGGVSPRVTSRALLVLFFGACMLLSAPVGAQTASEKAAAESLFDDGVRLLKAGEYERACKKLEKSQSVDPGIGTLLYLGECYKKVGRTASAWATFREAASKASAAGEEERARIGMQRADDLEPMLSYVTFEMPETNLEIQDLEVWQGDLMIGRALWGTALPVDPGPQTVRLQAPGYEPAELTITVKSGPSKATVTLPELEPDPTQGVEPPADMPTESAAATGGPEDEGVGRGRRTVGLVLGGVGVVGLGVGSVFGILALDKDSKADEQCSDTTCPDDASQQLANQAYSFGTVSTIGIAAGGALLVGGAVLYFTAPRSKRAARLDLRPTYGGGQISVRGNF